MKYFLAMLFFTGCSHSSNPELKSPLNRLNGEHYNANKNEASRIDVGIPIYLSGKRNPRETVVSGQVFVQSGVVFTPINNAKVSLYDSEDKPVLQVMSEAGGKFHFFKILSNGTYTLKSEYKKLQGVLVFEVQSYEIKDLRVTLHEI